MCCIVFAAGLLLTLPNAAAAASPSWWNNAYGFRTQLSVSAQDATPTGYSLSISLPHQTWVTAGQSLANGDDVRVVRWDGTTWTEIDRILDPHTTWNTNNTKIWFETQTAINASTADDSYWVYYGNSAAGAPPANANNVFLLYDDFNGGVLDTSKWWTWSRDNISIGVSGGQLVISGTPTVAQQNDLAGVNTNLGFNTGFISEADFSITTQDAVAQKEWKGFFGSNTNVLGVKSMGSSDKRVKYYDDNSGSWVDVADSSLDAQTFTNQHVATSIDATGVARYWENGVLKATRSGLSTNATSLQYSYSPDGVNAYSVAFDNVMIRAFVAHEPTVLLAGTSGASAQLTTSVVIDPELAFSVGSRAAGTNCNGVTTDTASTSTSVLLESPTAGANRTAAQDLTISTNAADGYTVYVRSTDAARSGSHALANWSGTNASPTAWTSAGTEGVGYSTDTSSLSGGTANRFTNGGTKWAGFSSTSAPIASASRPAVSTSCLAYRVGVSPTTPAGLYSTSLIMTAVANF